VPGQDLSEQQVKEFKQLSGDDKLYNQALRYVLMRPRSLWEMEAYLRRKNAAPLLSQKILNKLSELQLLDDAAFARAWVANRRLLKPVSRRRLVQELRQKHVPDEIAGQVLAEDETDERTTLRALVERKRARYPDRQKFMRYLASQGFAYDDIKSVLDEL
jgi:SOS response regulatory protein OraA/RecX